MRKEIDKAVEMFHNIAFGTGKNASQVISDKQLASFVTVLTELLIVRCRNNWYPDKPVRGSGYRCLRMNGQCMDPCISESLSKSEIHVKEIRTTELTIWVDPGVVSIRIGEEGSIGTENVELDEDDFTPPKSPCSQSSEDEAYASSDSVSPIPPTSSTMTHPLRNNVGRIPPITRRGAIPRLNSSPPSIMPHPTVSNAQDFMATGAHIPTSMAPVGHYSRPRNLFPEMDSRTAAEAHYHAYYRNVAAMQQSRQAATSAALQQMPRMVARGNYLDIPAQA